MHIVTQIRKIIDREILPEVPGKLKDQFLLGVNALSLRKFESLSSNSRTYGNNLSWKASEMKMYRLCRNERLLVVFYRLLKKMKLFNQSSKLNIDFTTWDNFNLLTFAVQTGSGRALPVWQEVIEYPIKKQKSQNLFILNSLHKFLILSGLKKIGSLDVNIICDRGFIGQTLIHGFSNLGVKFKVRCKSGIYIKDALGIRHKKFTWNRQLDLITYYHGQKYRVVRTSATQMKKAKAANPWHIITNDITSSRQEILNDYYHRFEIEEVFKDLKQLLSTKPRWFKKSLTLHLLLWFQILGFWLIYLLKDCPHLPPLPKQTHKCLSWYRRVLEFIWSQLTLSVYNPKVYHYRRKREMFVLDV
jgi:hypothetical protein